ncbi:MAG: hypothetical protein B7C24_16980 [Bacteroidetes bacterium 4572_77]|nr:MAG: hypothetical protein B7C24_16980 [Bacteroidetes bacterium 4572_77]
MQVYPNPADDEVNVSFILKEKCKVAIKVYDLSANLIEILRKPKRLKPDGYTFKYDLSSYQPGMYLIVVETNYGDKTVQRVLRN